VNIRRYLQLQRLRRKSGANDNANVRDNAPEWIMEKSLPQAVRRDRTLFSALEFRQLIVETRVQIALPCDDLLGHMT
jgi:hypothetical protein